MKKKKNYKLMLGLVIGIIISITSVYATTTYYRTASDLIYDNSDSWLTSTDVQGALDELYETKSVICPVGYYCEKLEKTVADLEVGDYVSYTPTTTSFTTSTTYTGYSSTQTIYPSELNLWRVLKINDDGTVDIISEYLSSTAIYFSGKTGYIYIAQYLNDLSAKYETTGITVGSRHFGYDGQTLTLLTTYINTSGIAWSCSTGGTCSPDPDDYEAYGGGDKGYLTDYNLVFKVLGGVKAMKFGTSSYGSYWISSRYYYGASLSYSLTGLTIPTNGSISISNGGNLYYCSCVSNKSCNNCSSKSTAASLRPIVTLSNKLSYKGVGTEEYPIEIVS